MAPVLLFDASRRSSKSSILNAENQDVSGHVGEVVNPVEAGDKYLVTINDRKSIVSVDEDELLQRQVEGDDIMILSLMKQTERLSVSATPKKEPLGS